MGRLAIGVVSVKFEVHVMSSWNVLVGLEDMRSFAFYSVFVVLSSLDC